MHINVPQPLAHQAIIVDELHHFFRTGLDGLGKRLEMEEEFSPVLKMAAGQFADDAVMANDKSRGCNLPGSAEPYPILWRLPSEVNVKRNEAF